MISFEDVVSDLVVVVVVVVEVWVVNREGFLNENFGLAVVQNNKDSGIVVAAVDFVCFLVEKVVVGVVEDTVVVVVLVGGFLLINFLLEYSSGVAPTLSCAI